MAQMYSSTLTRPETTFSDHSQFAESDAPCSAFSAGPEPFRVLVLTGELSTGTDLSRRNVAVIDQLEDGLARVTGRGVLVDQAVAPRMDLSAAEDALWIRDLRDYDGLIMLLEQDPYEQRPARSRERLTELLIDAESRLPVAASVLVAVTPPLHPAPMSPQGHPAFLDDVAASASRHATVVELPLSLVDDVPAVTLTRWAESIADVAGEMLIDPTPWLALLDAPRGPRAEQVSFASQRDSRAAASSSLRHAS